MKITSETLPERQVRLEIEVDEDRHNEAIEQAFKRLAPRVRVPGFRPGKAPRALIEREIGRHRLLDEAMDIIVPKAYSEAIEEEKLDPIAGPALEVVSHEPLKFTATVPLRPAIDLGDYKSLRIEREDASVPDERVDEMIETLRRRYGTIEPVDRPAKKGDIVRGDLKAEVDGTTLFEQKELEYRLTDEALASLPGLADNVVGLAKGADIEVKATAPEDFPDDRVAGKEISYHVAVRDVKEEVLSPLDESFAKQVGEGFESVDALRERIRSDLVAAAEDAVLHRYHNEAVDSLVAKSSVEYPAVLLEREIDRVLQEQANLDPRDPTAQDLYLRRLGKSEEEVRDEVREEAEQRLLRSLVLSQFAEAENITVGEEDVEAELQQMAASAGPNSDSIQRIFGTENGRDTIRRSILTRRALERLVEIAGASDERTAKKKAAKPAAEEEETSATAKKAPAKRRRAGPRGSE